MVLSARLIPPASRRAFVINKRPVNSRFFSATAVSMTKISEAIKDDHRELEQAYKNILDAQTSDEKIRWRNQFTWELARHSIGEELVVYPQFEKLLSLGKEMADHDRQEHLKVSTIHVIVGGYQTTVVVLSSNDLLTTFQVKKHLNVFQNLHPDDENFHSTLQALWTDLSQHIKEEEEHDLVALEENLNAEDSESMVSSFKRTKMFIPTRSHPSAPDKPPFETVAGLLSAPIDHLRDLFRKFPKESKSQLPP